MLPSLKLTFSPVKLDGWNTSLSYWVSAYFQGLWLLVSGSVVLVNFDLEPTVINLYTGGPSNDRCSLDSVQPGVWLWRCYHFLITTYQHPCMTAKKHSVQYLWIMRIIPIIIWVTPPKIQHGTIWNLNMMMSPVENLFQISPVFRFHLRYWHRSSRKMSRRTPLRPNVGAWNNLLGLGSIRSATVRKVESFW